MNARERRAHTRPFCGGAQILANALARCRLEPAAHVGPVLRSARRVEAGLHVRMQGLGPLRDSEDGVDVAHLRDAHLLDAPTARRHRRHRGIEGTLGSGCQRHEMHVRADPDETAFEAVREGGGEVAEGNVDGRGIGRIPACDDPEQEGCVGGRARHRPRVVERAGERPDPGGADAPVGRLEADGAAERRGHANRPARVAAEGERHLV